MYFTLLLFITLELLGYYVIICLLWFLAFAVAPSPFAFYY